MRFTITCFIFCLSMFVTGVFAGQTKTDQRKPRLYFAAALFNARETRFNLDVVKQLELLGYSVLLPQRDGFEYKSLQKVMNKLTRKTAVKQTTRDLIYLLDMGVFIPASDIIVASLDEPLDEGVIVELTYAHLMGKTTIGFRTDLRTPYGASQFGGMHSFVGFQCDYLIMLKVPGANKFDSDAVMTTLVKRIDEIAKTIPVNSTPTLPDYALANPVISQLLKMSRIVFQDANAIHTEKGLAQSVTQMAKHREEITKLTIPTLRY